MESKKWIRSHRPLTTCLGCIFHGISNLPFVSTGKRKTRKMIKPPKAANVALQPGRFFLACSGALLVPCGKTNSLGFAVAKIWSVRLYMVFVSSCFLSKDSFIKLSNLASNLWVCVSPGMATKKTSPSCPKTKPPTLLAFDRNFSGATSLERSSANTADSWIKTPQTPQGQSVKVSLCYLIWQVFWEQTHFAGHFHDYIQKNIKKKRVI